MSAISQALLNRFDRLTLYLPMILRAAVLGILVIGSACNRQTAQYDGPMPPELVVIDGATNVKRIANPYGGYELHYLLRADFPADAVVSKVLGILPRDQWKPLESHWLDPASPSGNSRSWSTFTDGTKSPNTTVHRLMAEWANVRGDVVIYSLRYDSPLDTAPGNAPLQVLALIVPSAAVTRIRQQSGITEPLR